MNTSKPVRIPTCPSPGQCDGFYVISNLPAGHPQVGRLVPCACTRARQAAIVQAGLIPTVQAMTFESSQVNQGNQRAFQFAREFADNPWGIDWFFFGLIGPNRVGKTHLAAAIVNALLAKGEPVFFENVSALLDDLRDGYRDGSFHHRLEQVKAAQVLVLDDLHVRNIDDGRPFEENWAHDKLYQIVDHRVMQRLPTVFTTNLVPAMMPERTASRLWDRRYSRVVAVEKRGKG